MEKTVEKLISVIIPVKNGEKYLEDAIEGIKKQNMNVEIIVVDDASTDRTSEIAERCGCTVLHHIICRGPVAGKNTGLAAAAGEYIMFHDADDIMRDGVLRRMYDELEEDSSVSAVMAQVKDFVSPELSIEEAKKCVIRKDAFYGLFTGAVLMRRLVFDIIGKFDENLSAGEIICLKTEMDERGMQIKKLDFISTDRRLHNSNYGRTDRKKEFKDYASILRAKMAARGK